MGQKASKMSKKAVSSLLQLPAPLPARAAGTRRSRVRHTRNAFSYLEMELQKYAAERATEGVPSEVMECET